MGFEFPGRGPLTVRPGSRRQTSPHRSLVPRLRHSPRRVKWGYATWRKPEQANLKLSSAERTYTVAL